VKTHKSDNFGGIYPKRKNVKQRTPNK